MNLHERVFDALIGAGGDPGTHMHAIGSSGTGKSKFLEYLVREAFYGPNGFAVIDWHGKLYDDLLDYLAVVWPSRPVYLLDPSRGQYITPYNPFVRATRNIGATASHFVKTTVKPWGAEGTNHTPRIEKLAGLLYQFALAEHETLPNAELLLRFEHRNDVARYALELLKKPGHGFVRENLVELVGKDKSHAWEEFVSSTNSRISRFLSDELVRRFLAFKSGNVDIAQLMSEDAVLLVNLAPSADVLSIDSARVFASFLLGDFYRAAMDRSGTTQHFMLILDEFQEYVTPDTAGMLDAVRKGGLHLVMSHQRMGHLKDADGLDLREAINVNARIKAAFAVTDYDLAYHLAPQLAIEEMIADRVKDEIRLPITTGFEYEPTTSLTTYESTTTGASASKKVFDGEPSKVGFEGATNGRTTGKAVTTGYERVPVLEELVTSRTFYTPEEKRNIIAGRLMHQPPRQMTIRFGSQLPEAYIVPLVRDAPVRDSIRAEYEAERMAASGAVSPSDADAELDRSREDFLARVKNATKSQRKQPSTTTPPRI